jgi:hypothetical protein
MAMRILHHQKRKAELYSYHNPALKKQEHVKYQEKNFGARLMAGLRLVKPDYQMLKT